MSRLLIEWIEYPNSLNLHYYECFTGRVSYRTIPLSQLQKEGGRFQSLRLFLKVIRIGVETTFVNCVRLC